MHFRIEQRFGLALDRVEDTLCDPRFVEHMAELPKLGRPQLLHHQVDGDVVHLQVRYAFAGTLSRAVTRVVDPAKLTWIEDSTVDRAEHRTSFRILPDHYASLLRCEGTFQLTGDGAATTRLATGELSVSVPLVGGKVERAILSGLEEHAREEVALVEGWTP